MKLSERAVLSSLHIGSWAGNVTDQQVTEEVSENHQADVKEAGRYSKKLIAPRFLRQVGSKISVARRIHRTLTLPWDDDSRILSTLGFDHYTEQMRLCRLGFEAQAKEFCKLMPEYIKEAKLRLGTMFDVENYPDVADIRKKFYLDVEIKAVPDAGDFRAELSEASVKAITKDIERRADDRMRAAMSDVFERIIDATAKMTERLRTFKPAVGDDPAENVFRDSLIYNITELADLLPMLNITDDPRLGELQRQLKEQLAEHSPEVLRMDEKLRREVAARAEKLHRKVKSYLG